MSLRRSRRCCSSLAPASSSIRTTSQVARSVLRSSPTRMHVGDPVSRRYSTHADVSTRIIRPSAHFVEVPVPTGSAHPASFLKAEWLRCERSQGKIDGFPLGRQAVTPHDSCTGFVVNIHVSACHTPTIHYQPCYASEQPDSVRSCSVISAIGCRLRTLLHSVAGAAVSSTQRQCPSHCGAAGSPSPRASGMAVASSVAEAISDPVALEVECADRLYLFSERGKSATNPHGGLFRVGHSRSANSERLQPQARNDLEIVRPTEPVSCPPETPNCASWAVSTGMRTVVPSGQIVQLRGEDSPRRKRLSKPLNRDHVWVSC